MAEKEIKNDESKEKDSESGKKKGLVGWIITFTVTVICTAGGFGLSGLFAKAAPTGVEETPKVEKSEIEAYLLEDPSAAKPWIHELTPIYANLNEPGSTRMVQFAVIMEISEEMDEVLGEEFLLKKDVYLIDWLTTYLAGLNLQQVSGSSSQNRIKVEIKENFNEILFPDTKPLINRVMLKGFTIQ